MSKRHSLIVNSFKKYSIVFGIFIIIGILCYLIYFGLTELIGAILSGKIETVHGVCRYCTGPKYTTIDTFPSGDFNMTFMQYWGLSGFLIFVVLFLVLHITKILRNGENKPWWMNERYIGLLLLIHLIITAILSIIGMFTGFIYNI